MAPTGFGKSVLAASLLKLAAAKGTPSTFIVDRVSLVSQISKTLSSYGISHGIIRSGVPRNNDELVQVCSAQTLEAQGYFPDTKLLIVDECHDTRALITQFIKSNEKVKVIGLTATPFAKGLGAIYGNLVNVCTTNQLLELKELAPIVPYAAKQIDMTDQMAGTGEWNEKVVAGRALKIVGDVVSEWRHKTLQHFGGPVKTLVFAASIAHGQELCRQFQALGFNFQQISSKDKDEDRREALIAEFRKPDSSIVGLVACEVFTKGFDVPDIRCGISARPYRKSLSKHIQQLGRVMRKSPGKDYALWLDHSGNYVRFLADMTDLFERGLTSLDDGIKKDSQVRREPTEAEHKAWTCSCGYIFQQRMSQCPICGKEQVKHNTVIALPGVLEAVKPQKAAKSSDKDAQLADAAAIWRQLCGLAREKKGDDHDAARRFAQRNHMDLYGRFSRVPYSEGIAEPPSEWLRDHIRKRAAYHAIRKAHGETKRAA